MKNVTLSGMPKRQLLTNIIISLLLIFIVYTLTDSFMRLQSLKNVLAFYTKNTTGVAWTILTTELIIAMLLFSKKTQKAGLFFTIAISLFSGYIVYSYPRYPHAFGGLLNTFTPRQHFIAYSLIIIFSTLGLYLKKNKVSVEPVSEPQPVIFT